MSRRWREDANTCLSFNSWRFSQTKLRIIRLVSAWIAAVRVYLPTYVHGMRKVNQDIFNLFFSLLPKSASRNLLTGYTVKKRKHLRTDGISVRNYSTFVAVRPSVCLSVSYFACECLSSFLLFWITLFSFILLHCTHCCLISWPDQLAGRPARLYNS